MRSRPRSDRLPAGGGSGEPDERWYRAAPLLDADVSQAWWRTVDLAPGPIPAQTIAGAMGKALGLRASRVTYSSISVNDRAVQTRTKRLHAAFAVRFGDE